MAKPKNLKERPQDVHRVSILRRSSGTSIAQAFTPQKMAFRARFPGKDFNDFDASLRAFNPINL
jgi:hypothetical protein